MVRLYFAALLLLFPAASCFAQIDTEFWFAPPEVTSGHGDRPLLIRISTQDQAAQVTVLQPALGNLVLESFTLAATSTRTVNLTGLSPHPETDIPDSVMKTGLLITSTAPITVYYEQASNLNSEIFVLKGKNALGNKFILPWQNIYDNNPNYVPTPYASFDVVATSNNTIVSVTPTNPVFGHEGERVITVKLNRGETYSFKKPSQSSRLNFEGTVVTSNKPIAITLKDDSVQKQGCSDLLGDQMIPVKVTGTEYVVPRGFLNSPEYLFITATEDNTEIYMSGISAPVARLNTGRSYRTEITIPSVYIRSTKKIYVLHVTGFGCEVGMAVLPPITCTGSKRISFARSTEEFFGLNILVRKAGIFSFKIRGNGVDIFIPPNNFSPVAGTNDEWYTGQASFPTTQIPIGQASVISNDQYSFQAGTINGNAATTCRYGYFSSFSTLFIGDDMAICEGDTATIDAGPGKQSYQWSTGATTQSIKVTRTGDYWVTVKTEDCILSDTLHVDFREGRQDLGPDAEICVGETTKIDGKSNFSWLWSDGSTGQYLRTSTLGKYWVSVVDNVGCTASDTILVKRYESIDADFDINLRTVSVDTADQHNIISAWELIHPELLPGSLVSVFKRVEGDAAWNYLATFPDTINQYSDPGNNTSYDVYEYYVGLYDKCLKEYRSSEVHHTMLLTGRADPLTDVITLTWNPYANWPAGVARYEVWRKLDQVNHYMFVATVSGNANTFSAALAADGFHHRYVIHAVEKDGGAESWSNPYVFSFKHDLTVPNVFTPNGDAFNQYFHIPKIELYKTSTLLVVDRWGKPVYEKTGYNNDWDGDGLSTGIYYYTLNLNLNENNQTLKGIVTVLR